MNKIGKQKFSDENYQTILKETNDILKELNMDILVNWSENK